MTIHPAGSPATARKRRPARIIVLVGIDGAGKSTAAKLLAHRLAASGHPAIVTINPCGRSRLNAWCRPLGLQIPAHLLDAVETSIRCLNVLVSQVRARLFPGIVIMDRYLYCQQALKRVEGLGPGRAIPWLLRLLPAPDVVFYLSVPADIARSRVGRRGADSESLEDLEAFDNGYKELDAFPSFVIIDASSPSDRIVEDIWQSLALGGLVPQR